jgi:uncharacterized protein YcnI
MLFREISKDRTIGPFRFRYNLMESGKRSVSVQLALPKGVVCRQLDDGDDGWRVGSIGANFQKAWREA